MVNFVLVSVLAVFGLRAAAAPAGLPPAPACSGTQYLNTATNSCVDCSVAFVNSTACYYQGATQCSYGNAVNGACTEVVCTGNNYISDDGKSCVQCPDSQAATCDRQGVSTSCLQYGARIVKGACYQPVCTKTVLYDPESNTCIPCSSIYTNASTCDGYKGATGCAYGNFIVGQCVPQDCSKNVGTYLSDDGKSCVQCPDRGAATCAPGGGQSLTCIQAGARVNTTTGQCYKPICTGTVLYDITSNTCKPCSTVFTNSSTCTSTAATGCAYGNFVSGKCVPQDCSRNVATYLSPDGKACLKCTDPLAKSCNAAGQSLTCSRGNVEQGVCNGCPDSLASSCTASGKSLGCVQGSLGTTGVCNGTATVGAGNAQSVLVLPNRAGYVTYNGAPYGSTITGANGQPNPSTYVSCAQAFHSQYPQGNALWYVTTTTPNYCTIVQNGLQPSSNGNVGVLGLFNDATNGPCSAPKGDQQLAQTLAAFPSAHCVQFAV